MKKKFHYSDGLYNTNSANEIAPYLMTLFKPRNVIDVGCGTGTWLSVFKKLGVNKILGVDASEFNSKMLIERNEYRSSDLTTEFNAGERFDLAICLEVAEHIPEANSDALIDLLVSVSDTIVFSAAIPGQGGQGHVNEQWLEYWRDKFAGHGYKAYDVIRPRVWTNEKVEWWYKQNMFILSKLAIFDEKVAGEVHSVVHPNFYNASREYIFAGKASSALYIQFLLRHVSRKMKSLIAKLITLVRR